jgi:uncharacterized tellurite resistance protein B-like protein
MHILIAVFGIMAAGAFWWYRLKMMNDAAGEVASQVGRVQGHFRRQKLRKKAAVSPVAAIDDPVVAAATVMMSIATGDKPTTDEMMARIRSAISPIAASEAKSEEAVTYAKWATDQVADVPTVIDLTTALLTTRLDESEKEDFVAMVQSIVPKQERHPMYASRIDRLRRKLGLVGSQ